MDININCKISLSKKLRAAIKNDDELRVILTSKEIRNGIGDANLVLSCSNIDLNEINNLKDKETNIQIIIGDSELKTYLGNPIGNIYSEKDTDVIENTTPKPKPIRNLAVTKAPEKQNVSTAIQPEEVVPKQFKEYNNKSFKKFASNLNELYEELSKPEKKINAIVVNDKFASLNIQDLDITLTLDCPFKLSNLKKETLQESSHIFGLIEKGLVKLIQPEQIKEYEKNFNKRLQGQNDDDNFIEDAYNQDEESLIDLENCLTGGTEQEELSQLIDLS